jgi:spore germination protein GerM
MVAEVLPIKKIILVALVLFIAFAIIGYRLVMTGDAEKLFENPKEFLFKEGLKLYNRPLKVDLYFISESGDKLVKETATIEQTLKNLPVAVFELLANGPVNKDLNPVIPPGTELLWAKNDGEVCIMNLSDNFINEMTKDETVELLSVYAIVNSITGIEGIQYVKILINSKEYEKLNFVKIKEPLAPDYTLLSE